MGKDIKSNEKDIQQFIESLYYKYRTLMIRIARRYLFEHGAAEDVLQDAFLQIIRKADYLRSLPPTKLEAYIVLMMRGICVDYLRKNHRKDQVDLTDEAIVSMLGESCLSKEKSASEFRKTELFMLLNKLPPEDQFLLIGRYYLELSVGELVTYIGGTATGVRSKLHRAKKNAFKQWKESGLNMEDFLNG